MKKISRIMMFGMAFCVGICGCNGNNAKTADVKIPDFSGDTKVWTFADIPPNPTVENLVDYFEAGFSTVVLTEDDVNLTDDNGNITEEYKQAVKNISEKGNVLFRNQYNAPDFWQNTTGIAHNTNGFDTGEHKIPIRNIESQLNELGNVLGYYQVDEPAYSKIEDIVALAEWQNNYAPDKLFHVNLFPSYAKASQTGGNYKNYLQHYADTVLSKVKGPKTLCIDNYPLVTDAQGKNYIRTSYLSDLLYVAEIAKKYNDANSSGEKIQTAYCIQAFSDDGLRYVTSKADIDFQINTGLAFGAKGFEYFLYETTLQMYGMVENGSYNHQPSYDYVKASNDELNAWSDAITGFEWQGIYTVNGKEINDNKNSFANIGNRTLKKLDGVSDISARTDTVVGLFKKDKYKGYMVTNFTEPSQNRIDIVSMKFKDAVKAVVYKNGKSEVMDLSDGSLSIILDGGGGAFVIPIF